MPIWFDRSEEALRHRDTYGGVTPATPAPVAFAPPRTGVPAGLRRVYVPAKGPYRATALAVMPLGDWLVAVRYSSAALDPAALDAKLTAIVAELGWPASAAAPVAAAVPVVACATTLHYRKARVKQPDMMQALLGASLAMTARSKAPGAAPVAETVEPLCRDGEASVAYAVYRAPGRTDGYLLALADAGVTVGVDRAFSLPGSADGGWGVTLHDVNGSDHIFASFDALPRPEQVVELVTHGSPVSSTAANGREVTIGIAPGK